MLDREFVLQNRSLIEKVCSVKKTKIDIEKLYTIMQERKQIITELNDLQSKKNILSKEIALRKKNKEVCEELFTESKRISESVKKMQETLNIKENDENELMKWIPNIPHSSLPSGDNASFEIIREKGKFEPKKLDYYSIAEDKGYVDFKRGAKLSASHFPLYIGKGAYLERMLINFMIDAHIYLHDYNEVFTPFLVNENVLFATGQLPKMRDDMYFIENDNMYLIPTSEPPVTCIHLNEILEYDDVMKKYVAYSACFRREAGSYGKDTKGLKRVHQFNKVEMVRYAFSDNSYEVLEQMVSNAEEILDLLGLDYRTILLPDNDISFAAAKTYDIEVWAPGSKEFLEVSSITNFEEFQARRANIRYKNKNGKNTFIHTLNGSGLATPRTVIAIMEQYQTEKGDFEFPPALQEYIAKGVSYFESL